MLIIHKVIIKYDTHVKSDFIECINLWAVVRFFTLGFPNHGTEKLYVLIGSEYCVLFCFLYLLNVKFLKVSSILIYVSYAFNTLSI